MGFALGPRAAAVGYRLAAYETIDSTNAEALRRAGKGDPGRLWIVAGAQTAGRGRRGRRWKTPAGNLAASLLLPLPKGAPQSATLGFAAGLALEQTIRACTIGSSPLRGEADSAQAERVRGPHSPGAAPLTRFRATRGLGLSPEGRGVASCLRLKWPNDLLLDGAKVAGILLEAVTGPAGAGAVVIGFGVNVRHAPEGLPYAAAALAAGGIETSAEALFAALSDAWVEQQAIWDEGRGFSKIRSLWLERAAGLGEPIAVKSGQEVLRGAFETIDEEGRLIIRMLDGGARKVSAGDVHFGAAATAEA